jgi:pimeloyl-ACP methyl ester carboxylesterase
MVTLQEFVKIFKSDAPNAKTYLFISGWESSLSMLKNIIEEFKINNNIIACKSFDNLFSGLKIPTDINTSIYELAADKIETELNKNNISRVDCILSHSSLGCLTALAIIEKNPNLVRSLVIMNGSHHILENDIQRIFWNQIPMNLRQNATDWIYDDIKFKEVIDRILSLLSKNPVILSLLGDIPDHEKEKMIIWNIEKIRIKKNIKKLNLPVSLIGAELDDVIPRGFLRELNKEIKGSELIFIPAANFDGPKLMGDSYLAVIKKFFKKYKI